MTIYSSQSNDVIEWMNRTLFNMIYFILDTIDALVELWAEIIFIACHIRNRLFSRNLDEMLLYEAWIDQKSRVRYIHKFECLIYRHINKKMNRKKLNRKSMKDYLIDYDSISIYHIYHLEIKIIKISRDIIFCENEFINKYRYKLINNLVNNDFNNLNSEIETFINDNLSDIASITSNSEQDDSKSSIIYNKITIQSPLKSADTRSASSSLNHHQQQIIMKIINIFTANAWLIIYKNIISMIDIK